MILPLSCRPCLGGNYLSCLDVCLSLSLSLSQSLCVCVRILEEKELRRRGGGVKVVVINP